MTFSYRQRVEPFSAEKLEAIAHVLGDTDRGLSGPEIGRILFQNHIDDPSPTITKWKRLYHSFLTFQNREQVGNHVIVFVTKAMDPAKYVANVGSFNWRRDQLNAILAFCGMHLGEDGKVRRVTAAETLDQALERANRVQAQLRQCGVHADVLAFCNAEILAENYFHAVFEAMKSLTSKIRAQSGLTTDGAELVDAAFGLGKSGNPILAINTLDSETKRGEQRGFVSLLKGLYGTIRNPLAHTPKVEWEMTEQDALDILTMISLVHRKLDKVISLHA